MTGRPSLTFTIVLFAAFLLAACGGASSAAPEAATSAPTGAPTAIAAATAVPTATPNNNAPAATFLSPAQLQEDFTILRTTLEEVHPGLYAYAGPEEWAARFAAVEGQLDREMSELAFYRLVAPLVVSIHDGHTPVWPAPNSELYASPGAAFLPFTIRFLQGRAYVDRLAEGTTGLSQGQEVLAVNGAAPAELLDRMTPFVAHDGLHGGGTLYYLGRLLPLYHALAFDPTPTYQLNLRHPLNGAETSVELAGLDAAGLGAFLNQDERATMPTLDFLPEEALAVLAIPSFDEPGLADFYELAFDQLKAEGVRDLIIDLRGNGGGSAAGDRLLYHYLAEAPFRYFDHLGLVFERPPTYLAHLSKPESEWLATLDKVERQPDGSLHLPHWYGLDQEQQPAANAFEGKVYMLIDGGCGSSTSEFAAIVHDRGRAVLIGQETFGAYWGNHSGQMPLLTLPNSGIVVRVPLYRFVMAVSRPFDGRGIQPDYKVEATPRDFINGMDTVMAYTLDLIREGP